jgi:hypothetical protein
VFRLAHRLKYTSPDEHANLERLLDEAGRLTFSLARSLDQKLKQSS